MRGVKRVFISVHSAYYLTPADLRRFQPGDTLFTVAHHFDGACGGLHGEFKWERDSSALSKITMTPLGPNGTTYRHYDITSALRAGAFK
jgi:hypothetical protein